MQVAGSELLIMKKESYLGPEYLQYDYCCISKIKTNYGSTFESWTNFFKKIYFVLFHAF